MSQSSFSQTYHANCLAEYEKLHHRMDHFQGHTHPLPDPPHSTISSWAPKFHFPQPYDWHHPDPTLPQSHTSSQHHFHFPPLSTHALTSRVRNSFGGSIDNVGHLAQPPAPVPTFRLYEIPPWVPNADIRETKHAYHIEIELPGVTDKKATTIQWLERGTLLVRGEIRSPALHRRQDDDDNDATNGEGTNGQTKADEGQAPEAATTEKIDGDWCALTSTHDQEPLTKGNPLARSLTTLEQEVAREKARDDSAAAPTPTPTPAPTPAPAKDIPIFLLRERKVGLWQRTFTLPLDVDAMGMKASLNGGLLEILLMKKCVDMGKVVTVEVK
jgi:HSP20 family molecular chaperone IbpA